MIKRMSQVAGLLLLTMMFSAHADNNIWTDIKPSAKRGFSPSVQSHQKARMLLLNQARLSASLENMVRDNLQHRFATVDSSLNISLPLPDGSMIEVEVTRENLLPNALRVRYPRIKTYRVLPSNEIRSGRLDMTPNGFHAMLLMRSGDTIFIDPKNKRTQIRQENSYVSYYKHDQIPMAGKRFSCGISRAEYAETTRFLAKSAKSLSETPQSLINYRIAIAASGEYTQLHGGTVESALAAITSTINRVNQVFEQDLGIHLTLVKDNYKLIYLNPDSDPFNAEDDNELLQQNQSIIDTVIGSDNYDIGHLFTTSGGGLAAIAGACNKYRKGQAVSGISNPDNESFNLDFVAHEIGHQIGATHTFNGVQGLCSGATRSQKTAFEPGSGSSIMAYAGYCGADNLQSKADAMFHIGSIRQIRAYAQTKAGSCGTKMRLANLPPVVNAGKDYIIPARTAFKLTGNATDPDSDTLVYAWEQLDAGQRSKINEDQGDNSLFRVYMPSSNRTRYFPSLESQLKHQTIRGEKLPQTQRELHFSFVAQDGINSAQSDSMTVQVEDTGERFSLYLPHSQYTKGKAHKILWNVAGTDKPPINCQSVDILLSTDGGKHFPQELAKNIPNTGEAWITISTPSPMTRYGRFKVACSDNIFYAISYRDFYVAEEGVKAKVLSDQDKPEPNNALPAVSNASLTNQSASTSISKGGSVNWLFLMLIALVCGFNKKTLRKSTK